MIDASTSVKRMGAQFFEVNHDKSTTLSRSANSTGVVSEAFNHRPCFRSLQEGQKCLGCFVGSSGFEEHCVLKDRAVVLAIDDPAGRTFLVNELG